MMPVFEEVIENSEKNNSYLLEMFHIKNHLKTEAIYQSSYPLSSFLKIFYNH
jgi:hypothetical protein